MSISSLCNEQFKDDRLTSSAQEVIQALMENAAAELPPLDTPDSEWDRIEEAALKLLIEGCRSPFSDKGRVWISYDATKEGVSEPLSSFEPMTDRSYTHRILYGSEERTRETRLQTPYPVRTILTAILSTTLDLLPATAESSDGHPEPLGYKAVIEQLVRSVSDPHLFTIFMHVLPPSIILDTTDFDAGFLTSFGDPETDSDLGDRNRPTSDSRGDPRGEITFNGGKSEAFDKQLRALFPGIDLGEVDGNLLGLAVWWPVSLIISDQRNSDDSLASITELMDATMPHDRSREGTVLQQLENGILNTIVSGMRDGIERYGIETAFKQYLFSMMENRYWAPLRGYIDRYYRLQIENRSFAHSYLIAEYETQKPLPIRLLSKLSL